MKLTGVASMLVLILTAQATAQSPAIAVRVTGEHRTASGDTPESARQLALVDAQARAVRAVVARLQGRADIKALQLKPAQVEAYSAVLLETQELPGSGTPAATRPVFQVPLRAVVDGADAARRMAALRKDPDASRALVAMSAGMQQLQQQLANQTLRRRSVPQGALNADEASAIVGQQLQTVNALKATHLAARATAALARTEPVTVGGRAPSEEGRRQARLFADAALALSPDSPEGHTVMGDILIDAQQPEAAETEYRKALRGANDSSSGRIKLAEALRLQGKFPEAVTELRAAIRIDPASSQAHSDLGLVLRGQRSVPEATAEYREAIRLDPDSTDAHNGLAIMLASQGRMADAVVEFQEMVRIDPDSAIGYYNLASALADVDRDVESAAALREVLRINPNHYNARYNIGELLRMEGKYDESARQFRQYLRLAPDTPQNRRNIARAKDLVAQFEN